ncbi:hypothetical protein H8R29_29275 (plasmid) [Priestia megaterium]|uniref:Uncharacterized protein n=1 Tax=Priestia megaterium (strain ATCC 14581 / DSM 32 / CCUG 1817 / JCM 2506 / NBRC 15308 / NCIMB 9376 / NCTC 10342 / NRRL B-14308 / VKM B-512 / Ford 19) TaxID=1348623 RepID=A0A0B6AL55_PRIM2|nr:hypothetical protein [Priestia megaterium]AJI25615.1 hypothetical protein BG04_5712 [Priestia megaterium NBRC 15308 = ATCC 14581]KFN07544.1 hypothetical protein DJ91_5350 [Priestia megaterium]KGJ81342.1 hypothetical protein BMT_19185 [Priestia megaterium NBRC 15308 = ATCC 14581]MDR4229771.1 hypothetical protein [Priestia megaterium]MED4399216.1 hypothetical protein [Priestia megaterium]
MRKTQRFLFRKIFPLTFQSSLTRPRFFKAYSFVPFSPLAMLDPTILSIGGIVLGMAIIERILERWGVIDLVDQFSKVMRFILPVTFYSALIYFFATFMF